MIHVPSFLLGAVTGGIATAVGIASFVTWRVFRDARAILAERAIGGEA